MKKQPPELRFEIPTGLTATKAKARTILPTFTEAYWKQWKPDEEHLSTLPRTIRDFIHALQKKTDPGGEILAVHLMKSENAALRNIIEKQVQKIQRLERKKK